MPNSIKRTLAGAAVVLGNRSSCCGACDSNCSHRRDGSNVEHRTTTVLSRDVLPSATGRPFAEGSATVQASVRQGRERPAKVTPCLKSPIPGG